MARRRHEEERGPIWLRPEPGRRRAAHSREDIARVALDIADDEGLGAVSMRRVARVLGAGTMTLYHYVRNKDELIALMDDAIMGEVLIPDDELPREWRPAISAIAHRTRRVFLDHPWSLLLKDSTGGPNGMRHFEQSLAAVAGTGLPWRDRLQLILMVDDYVFGHVFREVSVATAVAEATGQASPFDAETWPEGMVELAESLIGTGEFPNVEALLEGAGLTERMAEIAAVGMDESRFSLGLEVLLDGIESRLVEPAAEAGGAP